MKQLLLSLFLIVALWFIPMNKIGEFKGYNILLSIFILIGAMYLIIVLTEKRESEKKH